MIDILQIHILPKNLHAALLFCFQGRLARPRFITFITYHFPIVVIMIHEFHFFIFFRSSRMNIFIAFATLRFWHAHQRGTFQRRDVKGEKSRSAPGPSHPDSEPLRKA